jgi:hypothetical protein
MFFLPFATHFPLFLITMSAVARALLFTMSVVARALLFTMSAVARALLFIMSAVARTLHLFANYHQLSLFFQLDNNLICFCTTIKKPFYHL